VLARYARNRRLADALQQWAFCCLRGSPGARAYYQALRARGIGHQAALRQLSNRLVGILHGCLANCTLYNEDTAWQHHVQPAARHFKTWDVCRDPRFQLRRSISGNCGASPDEEHLVQPACPARLSGPLFCRIEPYRIKAAPLRGAAPSRISRRACGPAGPVPPRRGWTSSQ
jgi:hypothetical protein